MTNVVGHNEYVLQNNYASVNYKPDKSAERTKNSNKVAVKSVFAKELRDLSEITAKETSLIQ